ncbi:MAG: alpha/beta fold hydrolase, partial [Planctomycetes bacterium]|nr:alpha/beta fold hydrolase [Planctomycetota bacterium]
IRHDLPQEAIGHGLGFGDIDGDGRGDLVTARGWLQAPEDRRAGRWLYQPEFRLHRDASIPILVHDVDQDGDADLIWGRGHNIGLYWMEQRSADGGRDWVQHAIDTSWSQAHTLLLADLDNDGREELIAGKRYLGHDGRDPGEWDPLVIYWYDLDPERMTWRRGVVTESGEAGFDLDPKAADLDGDGDVDIIAPSRAGLYWAENLLIASPGSDEPALPSAEAKPYDPRDLSYYLDAAGESREVTSPEDWGRRRADILECMEAAMGAFPNPVQRVPLAPEFGPEEDTPMYTRRKVTFAVEPGDRVPAWLLIPKDLQAPGAAVLCLHQTTSHGKDELAALAGRENRQFAHELAERGFVCLVPDYPSFGEYPYDFKTQGAHYVSGSMKAIWNNVRAIDLLETLPEVHPDRIGCLGHSLGGHNSLFTAAFDQRIRAVVTSCGFTAFHHYYGGDLKGWTSDRYMPRIRDVYGNDPDRVPFDFYEVLGAVAPRGLFICAPLHDSNFENTGVKKVVAEVEKIYKLRNAADRLVATYPDAGHDFPNREEAYAWLKKILK